MKKPPRRALTLWRVRLIIAALPAPLLVSLFFSASPVWYSCLTALWVAAFLVFFLIYYPIKYHRLSYEIRNGKLVVVCGVLYSNIKAIEIKNIQHVSQSATPLQRIMSLCSVVVAGAGGNILISGVLPNEAAALCDLLIDTGKKGGA